MVKEIGLSNSDKKVQVDENDFAELSQYKWYLTAQGYARRTLYIPETKGAEYLTMHRQIMNAEKGQQVDHIDGNKLNNRRANLRFCSFSTNLYNSQKRKGQAASKYKGVCFDKRRNRWRAGIQVENRRINLGSFENEVTAARVRDGAALYYHKEFARLNFSEEEAISYKPKAISMKPKTSKYIGVSRLNKKWVANITVKNKHHYLGIFNTEEEALNARFAAEKRLTLA